MLPLPTTAELRRRLPRLLVALVGMGLGTALMVRAGVGLGPWDVLHQGISNRSGIPIGTVGIMVGLVVMVGWVPLRERAGVGTVLNVVVIGLTVDLVLPHLPAAGSPTADWAMFLLGLAMMGVGTGTYIGCHLGPGPRDGLMTAIAARRGSVRTVRTGIELTALVLGWTLGGTVGAGTVVFALGIGPIVQWTLDRSTLPPLLRPVPQPA